MHTPTIGDSSPRSVAVRGTPGTLASDTNVALAVVVAVAYGKFAGDMYTTGAAPPLGTNWDPTPGGSAKPVNCIFNEPVCVASSAPWCPDETTPNAVVAAGACAPGTVWWRLVKSIVITGALVGCNWRTAVIAWPVPWACGTAVRLDANICGAGVTSSFNGGFEWWRWSCGCEWR